MTANTHAQNEVQAHLWQRALRSMYLLCIEVFERRFERQEKKEENK